MGRHFEVRAAAMAATAKQKSAIYMRASKEIYMAAKVNGKKLHLSTFEIPTSGKNIRKCLVAQKKFAEKNIIPTKS